jgi:hypothetical protein
LKENVINLKTRLEAVKENAFVLLTIRNLSKQIVWSEKLSSLDNKMLSIDLPQGTYKLEVRIDKAELIIKDPSVPFSSFGVLRNSITKNTKPYYFRLPKNQNVLQLKLPPRSGDVKIFVGDKLKEEITVLKDAKEIKIPVNNQESNLVWKILTRRSDFKLINLPTIVALSPGSAFKPEE